MSADLLEKIKNENREDFYRFYKGLGYDEETSAVLSLFTYGKYKYRDLTIEKIYKALLEGQEYLPQEIIEEGRIRADMEKGLRAPASAPPERRSRERRSLGSLINAVSSLKSAPKSAPSGTNQLFSASFSGALPDCAPSVSSNLEIPSFLRREPAAGESEAYIPAHVFETDEYEAIEEKEARNTVNEPTSTFRMTTNTASAGIVLNQLRNSRRIDRNMVRIEEMMNYFRYDVRKPKEEMFRISCEMKADDTDRKYLFIHVQGREEVKERQNIVILLDISGSMHSNTEVTQAIMSAILSKLGSGDRLSLVTYCSRDSVELSGMEINGEEDRIRALEKILSLKIWGATYGSAGIEKAYQIGRENFIEGGNNQVILITDGDLNFGITDKGGLEELIEEKKKDNLFLSVIGTGLRNFRDDKLEVLSKHGNGVYRTANNLADVKKSVDEEYASLVNVIAKDVKAQVEFNPEVVESYRLLGYENRALAHEDFKNDKVISEPFGSGGYGVALYELTFKDNDRPVDSGLRYSRIVTTGSAEPGTVKIRYKEPLGESSFELEKVIETAQDEYTDNLRLAFVVYVCSEKLRGSDKITEKEILLAKQMFRELGPETRERNEADLYKLGGILQKSEEELGIGIHGRDPFPW